MAGSVTCTTQRSPLASHPHFALEPAPFARRYDMAAAIGIDFGTTNSVVAIRHDDGSVTTHRHAPLDVFRSVLCFWTEPGHGRTALHQAAGPEAITAYLEDPLDSRLIMSMKTYLAQRSFTETRIFGHPFTLERLIGSFLRALLAPRRPRRLPHRRRPPGPLRR